MKNLNVKLIAATLITAMLIPMGSVSAADRQKKNDDFKKGKISYENKQSDEDKDDNDQGDTKDCNNKWDWKIEKEKSKAEVKIKKEEAKAEWKTKKEDAKTAEKAKKEEENAAKKAEREAAKKALIEQKKAIKQNNDKIHEVKEEIIDQKHKVSEIITYINKNNIVISEDLSKQINDRLEMIKADITAINSSKDQISSIYDDIKTQLDNKDATKVKTGTDNVLAIQNQRYLNLQKLNDDLKVLLTLLEHAKEAPQTPAPAPVTENGTNGQTTVPGDAATTPAAGTSTDGQATAPASDNEKEATPAAGSNTTTQPAANADTATQPASK